MRRLESGDRSAAQSLWNLYHDRLIRLASRRLHGSPRGAADEEDVALIVLDEFFRRAERQKCTTVHNDDDLWRLLVVIVKRRVRNLHRDLGRQKRGGGHLIPEPDLMKVDHPSVPLDGFPSKEPPPDMIALWADECRRFFSLLADERLRGVATMRQEGYTDEEIAAKLLCTRRTVQRWLKIVRKIWMPYGNDSRYTLRGH